MATAISINCTCGGAPACARVAGAAEGTFAAVSAGVIIASIMGRS
jgi:hypothetical protein